MAWQLVERNGALFECNGALVSMDIGSIDECAAVCPGCYDDDAEPLFDNGEKSESGGSWGFAGKVATFTWPGHAQCDGAGSGFEAHIYACICVPTGHTLKLELAGDRPYGIPPPGGGTGIMHHEVEVDGGSVMTLAEETSTPENCTLSLGQESHTITDPGLYCLHMVCASNGMWYDAGSVALTLVPDPA